MPELTPMLKTLSDYSSTSRRIIEYARDYRFAEPYDFLSLYGKTQVAGLQRAFCGELLLKKLFIELLFE